MVNAWSNSTNREDQHICCFCDEIGPLSRTVSVLALHRAISTIKLQCYTLKKTVYYNRFVM